MTKSSIKPTIGTRSNLIQIIRAFAIIAVVMIHTTPSGNWQVFCRPLINFSVATFLFLSGYLTKIENDNWYAFYKKRISRVLIPYIIWTMLYTLASQHLERLPIYLLTAKAALPLYYIFVYIQFVLLTPLLGKLAKSKYLFYGWFIAPISVIIFKYYWLFSGQEEDPYISLIWDDSCLGWFTFYYLGLILGNRIIEKNYSLRNLILLYFASILLQIAEGYGWLLLGETNCGTQLKLTAFYTSSIFLLITYTILRNDLFNINSKFLVMLGDYSFGVYLSHIMVIKTMNAFIPIYNLFPYPITSVIVTLFSLGCCYIGNIIIGTKCSRWFGLR